MGTDLATEGAYVAAVEATYAAATDPALWSDALRAIGEVFGDVGGVIVYQRDDGDIGTLVSPGLDAAKKDYQEGGWWRHDVHFNRGLQRGYFANLDSLTDRHLVTDEEIESLPFYSQFLASHGLRWFVGTAIAPNPHVAMSLSVLRQQTRPAYRDDEILLLARLGRHVENAMRLSIRLISAEMSKLTLGDALARLGVGVFFLDGLGRLVFANAAGEGLLGDGLMETQGRLSARFGPEREALHAAIADAEYRASVLPATPRPVLIHGLGAPEHFLAVYVLPVTFPSARPLDQLLAGARTIVLAVGGGPGENPPTPPSCATCSA